MYLSSVLLVWEVHSWVFIAGRNEDPHPGAPVPDVPMAIWQHTDEEMTSVGDLMLRNETQNVVHLKDNSSCLHPA